MEKVLIVPGLRSEVSLLGLQIPLGLFPACGRNFLEHWLSYIAARAVRNVVICTNDRWELLYGAVGDGERWGLKIRLEATPTELSCGEALQKYQPQASEKGPGAVLLDHFPGKEGFPVFTSYESWFKGLSNVIARGPTFDQVGIRELSPGVFVSSNARISVDAKLRAPCWISDRVYVGPKCVIGPYATLETGAFLEREVEVSHSQVGPQTFLGRHNAVRNSMAWGDRLVNWQTRSNVRILESYVMSPLGKPGTRDGLPNLAP